MMNRAFVFRSFQYVLYTYAVILFFTSCLQAQPRSPKEKENYFLSGGLNFFQQSEYQAAINYFDEVLNLNPQQAEALEYRATSLFLLRKYEDAIRDYSQAITLLEDQAEGTTTYTRETPHGLQLVMGSDPKSHIAQLYNNCGNAYFQIGRYDEAYKHFDQALKLNVKLVEAVNNRTITLNTLKARGLPIPGAETKTPASTGLSSWFSPKVVYDKPYIGNVSCPTRNLYRIELRRNMAYFYIRIFNSEDEDDFVRMEIGKNSSYYVIDPNNSKITYKLKRVTDAQGRARTSFTVSPGEQVDIVLEFDRFPDGTRYVHLLEGDVQSDYACHFYDIQLQKP